MITQWDNKHISLSLHPMARVMKAQWKNEYISLSSPCPGRDSSVGE